MRSFEDEPRGETSEDDHPSTDASEDSVEVQVAPIARPNAARAEGVRRLPRKFRKAFEREVSPTAPLDFSVTSLAGSPENSSKGASASPPPIFRAASPPRVKPSRRKPSEPRRVVEQEASGTKRSHEHEWAPRKAPRVDVLRSTPGTTQGHPLPQHDMLGHNPFMGPFVPPHLLLPPSWPHVARYPYAHLVGGVLGPPLGFLPSAPYPLLPILPPRVPPPSSPKGSTSEAPLESEKLVKVNGLGGSPLQPSPLPVPSPDPTAGSSSPTRRPPSKQASFHKKFLSVESLLSVPPTDSKPPGDPSPGGDPLTPPKDSRSLEEDSDAGMVPSPSSSGEGGSIHALLQRPTSKQKQRNYKNMTRERRIEANARERTRVHTISAAFETLRRAVPSFSHNQKLSKLSVLRIASSYILALSRLAGHDYSRGGTSPSFEECVDLTTKTIQVEGKTKKKRED